MTNGRHLQLARIALHSKKANNNIVPKLPFDSSRRTYVHLPTLDDIQARMKEWITSQKENYNRRISIKLQDLSSRSSSFPPFVKQWKKSIASFKRRWNRRRLSKHSKRIIHSRKLSSLSASSLSSSLDSSSSSPLAQSFSRRAILMQKWKNSLTKRFRHYRRHFIKHFPSPRRFLRHHKTIQQQFQRLKHQVVTLKEYSKENWFDQHGYPLTSRDPSGRFVNPWSSQSTNGNAFLKFIQWRFQRLYNHWNDTLHTPISSRQNQQSIYTASPMNQTVPRHILKPHLEPTMQTLNAVNHDDVFIHWTWIGHSTTLVSMGQTLPPTPSDLIHDEHHHHHRRRRHFTIVTDPMFSQRAAPFQGINLSINGVPRHVPPACSMDDVLNHMRLQRKIDVCLISHDHYDHLDYTSCIGLADVVKCWIVPLGIKSWLVDMCNIPPNRIVELQWWDQVSLSYRHDGSIRVVHLDKSNKTKGGHHHHPPRHHHHHPSLTLTCTPTQHWSARNMWDRNRRLWCSWVAQYNNNNNNNMNRNFNSPLNGEKEKKNKKSNKSKDNGSLTYFFGGDSGYPTNYPLFEMIRQRIEVPIDLAALPIGAYKPSWFMSDSHVNPREAVKIHNDLGAKTSAAIHWGCFRLADESDEEPAQWLQREVDQKTNSVDFRLFKVGQSMTIFKQQEKK